MRKNIIIIIILSSVLLFGIYFRLHDLSSQSYWMDEGYTVNAALSIMEKGLEGGNAILDSGETYFCPLYCYPTAKIAQIIGGNALSFRLLAALAGILFIVLIYFITNRIFNRNTALLTAFFTSFSYWQIAWSRQARWYTLLALFFWLALFFFYRFLYQQKQKNLSLFLTLLFTVLAALTHKVAYLLPMIMIGWAFIEYCWLNKNKFSKISPKMLIGGIAGFAGAILLLEYGFNFHFIKAIFNNISFNYKLPYYLNFYLRNYWLFIFFALFAFFNAQKSEKIKICFLVWPFLIYLFCLSFLTDIVHYRYLFHLTPVFYILGSIGIIASFKKIKYNYIKAVFISAILLLFFISEHGVIKPKQFYFLESDDPAKFNRPHYAYTPQPNFNNAYNTIKKVIKDNEIIISSHPHFNKIFLNQPGYWIKYNYLGMEDKVKTIKGGREYYVNAKVINDLPELQEVIGANHGYIVFDYMAADNRIPAEIINYITANLDLVLYDEINSYSKIWVYKF